jgi:two-component system, NtrC family, response regulator AlgB
MEISKSDSIPANRLRVLVIDDEKNIRATLSLCLEQMGCTVTAVSTAEAALAALRQQPYEVAFLDLRLGESSGLDLIPKLLTLDAGLLVIVITAYATIDTAVEAIKRGAADYLPKPFTPEQIRHVVDQSVKQRDLRIRLSDLEGRLQEAMPAIDLEPDSPKIRSILEVAAKAAVSDVPVLLAAKAAPERAFWRA